MRIPRVRAGAAGLAACVLVLGAGVVPAEAAPVRIGVGGAGLVSVALADDTLSLRIRDAGQIARGAGEAVTDTRTLAIAVGDGTDPNSGFGTGDGTGDGTGSGSGDGAGRLPRTGESWVLPASVGGALLVAAGILLVYLTRRRRPTGQLLP